MFLLWVKRNRHQGSPATKGQRGQLVSPNKCHTHTRRSALKSGRVVTDGDRKRQKAQRQRPGSTSPADTIPLCALASFIIPPRVAIVSVLWMSRRQSPRSAKVRCDRKPQSGISTIRLVYQLELEFYVINKRLLGAVVSVLFNCAFGFCTCKLCLQLSWCARARVCVFLKSDLHICTVNVWLPLILFDLGFKPICRLHLLLFY